MRYLLSRDKKAAPISCLTAAGSLFVPSAFGGKYDSKRD